MANSRHDTDPASTTPFQYPVGYPRLLLCSTSFVKAVEFSPRGEARINNSTVNATVRSVSPANSRRDRARANAWSCYACSLLGSKSYCYSVYRSWWQRDDLPAMKRLTAAVAFSLVELTLAIGIAAFCLIAVFGLIPVGVQTNRNATSQTAATNILSSVVSDIRASPPGQTYSAKYHISRSKLSNTTLYFDGQGQFATSLGSLPNSRYRLYVQIANQPAGNWYAYYAWLRVSWPAAANPLATPPITPSGSVETVATYFFK